MQESVSGRASIREGNTLPDQEVAGPQPGSHMPVGDFSAETAVWSRRKTSNDLWLLRFEEWRWGTSVPAVRAASRRHPHWGLHAASDGRAARSRHAAAGRDGAAVAPAEHRPRDSGSALP